ncbi:MAG: hypothetical protein GXP39_00345 [Chloroflexi bacterium]|nr:hypothetical protein [Chloroflexota bacterium]
MSTHSASPSGSPISAGLREWLLAEANPSARYWALRTLLGRPEGDPEVREARAAIPRVPPALDILRAQWPEGYWVAPGIGYSPRYRATIWQILFLAQLGAPPIDGIRRACAYVLAHARLPDGRFTAGQRERGAFLCLNGNLLRALCWFGLRDDPRVQEAADALAAQVVHQGLRCRCNGGETSGPMTGGLPCAWGAIKAGLGLLEAGATGRGRKAALAEIERLLVRHDLVAADFPTPTEPSPLWWRFGFPLGYHSDALEALLLLGRLGHRSDPRLRPAVRRVLALRDSRGRWRLEHRLERTWGDFGALGRPNKWITLRALWALQAVGALPQPG